ncbi:MAG: glycoside hydrolase family 15 protein [Dermatophilaceae bacterium]
MRSVARFIPARRVAFGVLGALVVAAGGSVASAQGSGDAPGAPGGGSSWATGNKIALGTATGSASPVWFTVANGVMTEVFYPRADVPNVQDMQYVVSDGATFVELERDATTHAVSMPDERALEHMVVNTAKNGRYRLTNTYVTDPARATVEVRTHFQSLDGGSYQLYALYNPSLAGGGGHDTGSWDATNGALVASDSQTLFAAPLPPVPVASSLQSSVGFVRHSTGYSGTPSDGYQDIAAHKQLTHQYDRAAVGGNITQTAQIPVGADSTFTLALGFGPDTGRATSTARESLTAGFSAAESAYRSGWHAYLGSLSSPVPASVAGDTVRRRVYTTAVMALHAHEDKSNPGAAVASLSMPWGDSKDGNSFSDGYHRVWGRDLYHQATAMLAAGDRAQATRMARWLWDRQYIGAWTPGSGVWYGPGSFPRYSPVSGVVGATPAELGCCEQHDQDAFAIILAWMTGLNDPSTYAKIKTTTAHLQTTGPDTPAERWEEQAGKSPSTIAAEIAALITAADIARANEDPTSAASWEKTADAWRASLPDWTFTYTGYWGDHQYYDRIEDISGNPNDNDTRRFKEGSYAEHDIVDAGFLELVRLGVASPPDPHISGSLPETDAAFDGHAPMRISMPNGDVYWHRYVHDSYGESNTDGSGWDDGKPNTWGRLWPLLSGERGEYELANHRPATLYLQSMADAANVGHFIPEQIWDQPDAFGFQKGKATGSAAPLAWAEAQYIRLAQSIDAGHPLDTPTIVQARYPRP